MEVVFNKNHDEISEKEWDDVLIEVSKKLNTTTDKWGRTSINIDNIFYFQLPSFYSIKNYRQHNRFITVHSFDKTTNIGEVEYLPTSIKIFIDETLFDDIKKYIDAYQKETQLCKNIWVVKKLVVESILKGNWFSKKKEFSPYFTGSHPYHTHTYTCCNKTFYLHVSRDNILNSNEDDFILHCVDGYDLKISQIQNSNFKDKLKALMTNLNKEQTSLAETISEAERKSSARVEKLKSEFVDSF